MIFSSSGIARTIISNSSSHKNLAFYFKHLFKTVIFIFFERFHNILLTYTFFVDAVCDGNCLPGLPLLQRLWGVPGLQRHLDLQRVRHRRLLHQLLLADVHLQAEEVTETEQEQVKGWRLLGSGTIHRTLDLCREIMIGE